MDTFIKIESDGDGMFSEQKVRKLLERISIRLNLGAGEIKLEGYEPRDAAKGDVIFPLPDATASVDEIRASHVLEHFPHGHVQTVVNEWVRALKPGGELKIAVPDFEVIAEQYLRGAELPIEGYVMGGQIDARDFHKSMFDFEQLADVMRKAGLVAINGWKSEIDDCAAMPISLNLRGWKRPVKWPKVSALMSVPRLGFMDNFYCFIYITITVMIYFLTNLLI